MTLWVCNDCGTKYAVGLFTCPRCRSTEFHEDGEMPKITKADGATDATLIDTESEGEQPSVGTDSSTSSENPSQSSEQSSPDQSSPAQTAESPLPPDQTESGTADSTAGDQTVTEPDPGAETSETVYRAPGRRRR